MTTLPALAQRAVANAEMGLRFEKDWRKVGEDAKYDRGERSLLLSGTRLATATRYLLAVTATCAQDHVEGLKPAAAPKLVLYALCQWVEEELAALQVERDQAVVH